MAAVDPFEQRHKRLDFDDMKQNYVPTLVMAFWI